MYVGVIDYLVCQYEYTESGNVHLQGYVEFGIKKRQQWLKKHIDGGAHWAMARGDAKDNLKYCTKEESRVGAPDRDYMFTMGEPRKKKQGKRNDLERVRETIVERKGRVTELELYDTHFAPMVRYTRALTHYRDMVARRNVPVQWSRVPFDTLVENLKKEGEFSVVVLHGPTGTGKSWNARQMAYQVSDSVYLKAQDNMNFDGYADEEVIIWEEFRGKYNIGPFLNITDEYRPAVVHSRYVNTVFKNVKLWIFTSPDHPDKWFWSQGQDELSANDRAALMRRITDIIEFDERRYGPHKALDVINQERKARELARDGVQEVVTEEKKKVKYGPPRRPEPQISMDVKLDREVYEQCLDMGLSDNEIAEVFKTKVIPPPIPPIPEIPEIIDLTQETDFVLTENDSEAQDEKRERDELKSVSNMLLELKNIDDDHDEKSRLAHSSMIDSPVDDDEELYEHFARMSDERARRRAENSAKIRRFLDDEAEMSDGDKE